MSAAEKAHKKLMSRMLALWNGELGHVDAAESIYAHNFVGNGTPVGVDAVKSLVLSSRRAFPDQRYEVSDEMVVGNRVVLRLVWTGTHTGEWESRFGSLPPTGRSFSVGGVEIFEIAGGKIRTAWAYYDMLTLFEQLGITPRSSGIL
jgi:steroid delta-isomerase-like uncharacterized protein